jgi:hypothetical protein
MFESELNLLSVLMQYSATHHSFLDRCKLLLHAAQEPQATAEEEACLRCNGFRDSLLTDGEDPEADVHISAADYLP